jgi:hypothetical protein
MQLQIFWTTQMLGVATLALAKLSLVAVFQRIVPKSMFTQAMTWLLFPVYISISLFLVAFQCQLPEPWKLTPKSCNTHGNVYYPITALNMLTDAMLAFWTFPVIWGLQMNANRKCVILLIFGSRLLICGVDSGRMIVISRALQQEDQTSKTPSSHQNITKGFQIILDFGSRVTDQISGSQLIWAVMDQIVVHLSVNHATLPFFRNILSSLHTAGISRGRISAAKAGQNHLNENKLDLHSNTARNSGWNNLTPKRPSTSERPLWSQQQQQQGIELSTIKCSGKGEAEQRYAEQGEGIWGIRVQTDVLIDHGYVS